MTGRHHQLAWPGSLAKLAQPITSWLEDQPDAAVTESVEIVAQSAADSHAADASWERLEGPAMMDQAGCSQDGSSQMQQLPVAASSASACSTRLALLAAPTMQGHRAVLCQPECCLEMQMRRRQLQRARAH